MTSRSLVLVLAAAVLTAACGGSSGQSPAPAATSAPSATQTAAAATTAPAPTTDPAEPRTAAAAKAMAQEEADRYSAGDYEGAWELWAAADKRVISGADYARFHEACTTSGIPLKVESVRLTGDQTTGVARLSAMGIKFSYRVVYEDGHWRWRINDDDLAGYRKGADRLIADAKKSGKCHPG